MAAYVIVLGQRVRVGVVVPGHIAHVVPNRGGGLATAAQHSASQERTVHERKKTSREQHGLPDGVELYAASLARADEAHVLT